VAAASIGSNCEEFSMAVIEQALETPPAPSVPGGVPGVALMDEKQAALQRRLVLIFTVIPFAGFLLAIVMLWGTGLTPTDAGIALTFYLFTGLGVTVGYHRLFTHQSFEASRPLKIVLAIAGSMSVQGNIIGWVATHRRHHAFSDQEGDPHSPHLDEGPGYKGVLRGLWHAHVGWMNSREMTDAKRWAPDMVRDPDIVRVDKAFGRLTLTTFVLPALLGLAITRSYSGMVTAFLWGSLARIFFLHHVTWSINSICHFFGKRPFSSPDFSTNNWVLSILSFGESWHNNHHAFPTSAVHGIGRGQVDMSGWVIRVFEKLKLAKSVKLVSPKQLAQKAITEFKVKSQIDPERRAT
jgi:stearoyl-CoA desaturase (delta-9 desaturase)